MENDNEAMEVRAGVEVAGMSDVGCQRQSNEDRYGYWEPSSDAEFEDKGRLAVVADGMGGHEGGQDASRIAVDAIRQLYATSRVGNPQALLTAAFREAHERIHQFAAERPALRGMGTTATAIVLRANRLYYSHIGDSRLYMVRGGRITRLTHDHSYVGSLVDNGFITSEEAETHPQRHILMAALGAGQEFAPESPEHPIPLASGDVLVLCTDGLWGLVGDDELEQTVAGMRPADACRALVGLAKERGGPDNITVQVLRLD
ncbi:MAG TPA: PP2C family serine/threonine-protein phosphatase [Terriglobales bacterium]|nr:PP2C family serine/threonine-protein phosphatase [Terriglobales bacterium]